MKANKAFFFAYPNGFGDVRDITEMINVDFGKHEGHGICFRAGVDFECEKKPTCLHIKVKTTENIRLRVEFKTEASGGCADKIYMLEGTGRWAEWYFDVPKMFSPIKEVCIAALKEDNVCMSACQYSVALFELL